MKIELITPQEHAKILDIYNNNHSLFLQNVGYEYINKNNLSDEAKADLIEVSNILKKSIIGFSSFSNFRKDRNNETQIRFQYDWTAHDRSLGITFTGVGYILLDELLNGFKN